MTYTLDSLDACANYSVKVFAVNMPGDAGVSNEITITMPVGGRQDVLTFHNNVIAPLSSGT